MISKANVIYTGQYCQLSRDELVAMVEKSMSQKRFKHVLGVEEMALSLAKLNGESLEKASIAALAHDYAKERPDEEMQKLIREKQFDLELLRFGNQIWHGIVGAYLVQQELSVTDEDILTAIRLHTTGAKEMSLLAKIIYVADYVEVGRSFPGVEQSRQLALSDLDAAVAYETEHTLLHLIKQKALIYPKTIETYNQWVSQK